MPRLPSQKQLVLLVLLISGVLLLVLVFSSGAEPAGEHSIFGATSYTSAKNQDSKTIHEKEKLILTPQETMDLDVGEFLGSVAASNEPFFRMNLSPIGAYHPKLAYEDFKPLPITTRRIDAKENFQAIRYQVREIVKS